MEAMETIHSTVVMVMILYTVMQVMVTSAGDGDDILNSKMV